ncbi:hypothetical protein HOF92_14755 [bacterium]|nr:hypothetical protein [bacterium]
MIGCVVNGVVSTLGGDNPIIGCIDGVVGTKGARYVPIMELEGITLPESHPDLRLLDKHGMDFRNSLLDTHTGRIASGPYQGKCVALLNGYITAVECGKPDSTKLILNQF